MENEICKSEIEDPINRRILEGLLRNQTLDEIAEELNVAVRTVQNRIKQLEKRGCIVEKKKGVWEVNYRKIGLDTIAVVLLSVKNSREDLVKLIEHLKRLDYVENVFEIIGGEFDLCVIVRFRGLEEAMKENDLFIRWMNRNGILVDDFKAYISGKTHKDHRRSII
ncbi:HTH domain-containing protein [Geoglobus acetivorans]|uniref:HTH domain-containing protein n=1 Tax=Geoglobus acetivorans TaxID=565033 RepID=A0ABZ3H2X5_GEOAI|nr:HTH domain-containing protein [Geoglobus acetivorans]